MCRWEQDATAKRIDGKIGEGNGVGLNIGTTVAADGTKR
jgi:hypothetical protein